MANDPLISLNEARAILLEGYSALGKETLPLEESMGRVLAEPVVARHDQPPAPISAMDGYAVRSADALAGATLRIVGEAPAGGPYDGAVRPGECVKIATGGVVPSGADRVIIQENITAVGDSIVIRDVSGPCFVRPAAMDFSSGAVLIEAGQRIGAAAIGLIAASGESKVTVHRRPRVAILAAGDELRDPGQPLEPGSIYNSAAFALSALVETWGGIAVRSPLIPDDLHSTVAAIRDVGEQVDLFLPLGGASVGDRDLFRPAFRQIGAGQRFWRINVVPGKPCWHARFGDGRAALGLPGNPTSAFVCAFLLLRPLLYTLMGRDPDQAMALRSARLTHPLKENGPREAWLRASAMIDDTGTSVVTVDDRQDSGLQTPLLSANGLVRRAPHATSCEAGSLVRFLPVSQDWI